MKIEIDESDLKDLHLVISKIIDEAPELADTIMKNTSAHIESQAKQLAPTGQYPNSNRIGGWLKRNIRKGKDSNGYTVTSHASYSLWVEYGNRWTTGTSYFRPAIAQGMKYMEEQIKKNFNY